MAFPLSYSRTEVFYIYTDNEIIRKKTEDEFRFSLQKASMNSVYTDETGKIHFWGEIFRFVWNGFNLFNGINKGWFKIELENDNKITVSHKLYFHEVLILCCIFTSLPIIIYLSKLELIAWAAMAIVWIGVYTGNYVLSFARVNSFIDDNIEMFYSEAIKQKGTTRDELRKEYFQKKKQAEEREATGTSSTKTLV